MPNYPKFNQKLNDTVLSPMMRQAAKPGYAVVLSFNPEFNTCDVVTAMPGSDQMGEVLSSVSAPVQSGIQAAAPKPGMLCWLEYRDGTTHHPYISHFFNPLFYDNDYQKQYKASMDTPRFMLNL